MLNLPHGAAGVSTVSAALEAAVAERPFERKLLVCPRMGVGRELLRNLATRGVAWINFEVTTPRQLAHALVAPDLTAHGLAVADEFDELALLDAAIDGVLDGARGRLAELAEGTGLRQAVGTSVRALRLAGIGAAALERSRFRDEDKREQLARILDDYERRLRQAGLVDGAALMARAAASLAVGDAQLRGAAVYLTPGQACRGVSGQLLLALLERGARLLSTDPVFGMDRPAGQLPPRHDGLTTDVSGPAEPPHAGTRHRTSPLSWLHDVAGWTAAGSAGGPQSGPPGGPQSGAPDEPQPESAAGDVVLDVFAATSVSAELREVLRRVMAAGLQWDEVEIIATDAAAYGVALDSLARRLDIPVGYAVGLPAARTRPGRAVAKYLEWVQQGFPADKLRQMLERGDIASVTAPDVSGMALSRRLRALKIGRGRDRYEAALQRRQHALATPQAPDDERSVEEFEADRHRERLELEALAGLLRPLLAATPAVPDRLGQATQLVTPAALAHGLLAVLALVPVATALDGTTAARLRTRLQRIAATATRGATLDGAIAVLMSKLEDRVPAPAAEGASPWTSTGGHLHLSDLEHGGYSGRRATFIVGLDAARFPGTGGADALLVDDDRRRLAAPGEAVLPTAAERVEERRYAFASLAARLRGRVTFSYSTWDAVEGRTLAPAAELLQAYRLLARDPTADYEALHAAIAPAVSAVPPRAVLLDSDDVWLHSLSANGALRWGVGSVCGVYPGLDAGVRAWKTRLRSTQPTAHHGFIQPRPELDPRNRDDRVVSATQLQTLGTCPHRYLLRYVLRVKAPEDPELSPEQWLPPLEKGSLLHAVYEAALRRTRDEDLDLDSDGFEWLVLELLDEGIDRARELLPPPGEAVFELERERLRDDARAFVAMVREDGRRFVDFEVTFGRGGAEPVAITLPDGATLRLAGAIDRVDRLEDGRLVIVDYKTGSSLRYGGRSGVFDGGRRLQHVLYSAVAKQLFGAEVARAEYHFPSRRSENYRARFDQRQLNDGPAIVTDLLDLVRNGWFLPTNAPDDCRFCEFAATCRVEVDGFGKVTAPLADWSRESQGPAADVLRRVRR